MIIQYNKNKPQIHPSSYIAPTAVIRGDVTIGENTSVLFGAVITAEGGSIEIGSNCVIMENSVLRGVPRNNLTIGDQVLVGPHSHVSGATIEDNVFIATGSTVFNGAVVSKGSEIRINSVVHTNTRLGPYSVVPISWVAVGDPAQILPPNKHEEIWEIQKKLDFPRTVFKANRNTDQGRMIENYAKSLHRQRNDMIVKNS